MALGVNYEPSAGGDFLPIVKYDSKAGRIFRVDRNQTSGESTPVDITKAFRAVFDLDNIEVGWINFDTGGAPDFQMVRLGETIPPKPSDKHRQGTRITIKLGKESGGDVREMASVAKAALRGLDALHDAFLAGKANNAGKLPVVSLKDTTPITTGEGARKSTNYSPVFEIIAWVDRPKDLIHKPRGKPANGNGHATPPATGSTQVAAPVAATQPALSLAEDFG